MGEIIPTVLVDSVIMIDHFNGIPAATQYLLEMQGQLAISVITRVEVLPGFEGKERQLARRLLDRFPTLVIDRGIADLAATCGGRIAGRCLMHCRPQLRKITN